MTIRFIDVYGNNLPAVGTFNIGSDNAIFLELSVLNETSPITGEILRNTEKIGSFVWSSVNGLSVNWYTGTNQPIYVKLGDVITARKLTPSVSNESQITIDTIVGDIAKIASQSDFIRAINPVVPNVKPNSVISKAIDEINKIAAVPIEKNIANSINVTSIREYYSLAPPLPAHNAMIYATTAATNAAIGTAIPPTNKQSFNSNDRFQSNAVTGVGEYYTQASPPPGGSESAQWVWDDALSAPVQQMDTVSLVGILLNNSLDYYDLEYTLKSSDPGDDWAGIVMAFVREGNVNHTLLASVCCDGTNGQADPIFPNVTICHNNTTIPIMANSSNDNNHGWNSSTKRIRVSRRGDVFTVYASNWNSGILLPNNKMVININDYPNLHRFKGPKPRGYFSRSQGDSTFYNQKRSGGIMNDTIINAQTNQVYRWDGAFWNLIPINAQGIFSAPRILIGNDSRQYRLNVDNTITALPV